jgi:hypothetical protein
VNKHPETQVLKPIDPVCFIRRLLCKGRETEEDKEENLFHMNKRERVFKFTHPNLLHL